MRVDIPEYLLLSMFLSVASVSAGAPSKAGPYCDPRDDSPRYVLVQGGVDTLDPVLITNRSGRSLWVDYFITPGTTTEGEDILLGLDLPPALLQDGDSLPLVGFVARAEPLPRNDFHEILEIFARVAAYESQPGDNLEDTLFLYGLDGLGYVVSRFHSGPGDFQGLGLTSDETFTLRVEWRLANGGPGGDLCFWEDRVITVRDLDRPPVLALRGTEPAKIQDLFTDFDPSGVGWGQFNASRFLMERWLDEFRSPEESLQVKHHITGHSLGDALAQWIAAYYTQSLFEGSLGDIVTFNTPGISRDGASRFDRFRAEAVTHYITSADLASLAGEAFLPPTDKQRNLQNHNPAWVKSSYLSTYESILGADRADFKHSAPVIAPIVYGDPPRVNQVDSAVPFPTVDDLSGDLFSYSFPEQLVPPQQPDPDYFAFQLWVAETLAPYVTTPVGALIAAQLSFRASVELNRQQIGTLLFDPGINFLPSPPNRLHPAKT